MRRRRPLPTAAALRLLIVFAVAALTAGFGAVALGGLLLEALRSVS